MRGPHRCCRLLAPWGEEKCCDQRGALWPWYPVPPGTAPPVSGGYTRPGAASGGAASAAAPGNRQVEEGRARCFGQRGHGCGVSCAQTAAFIPGLGGTQQGPPVPPPAAGTVPDPRPLGAQEHRAALITLWHWAVPTPLCLLPVCCFPPSLSPSPLPEIASEGRAVRPHPGRRWRGAGADLQARRPSRYVLPEVLGACRGHSLPREEHRNHLSSLAWAVTTRCSTNCFPRRGL